MQLFTAVPTPKYPFTVTHSSQIMSLGSCFAQNMAEKLAARNFVIANNPFGITFHPLCVANQLKRLIQNETPTKDSIEPFNDQFVSFQHHSSFNALTADECLANIKRHFQASAEAIKNTDLLLITMGTAWGYYLKTTNTLVNNCHKVPQNQFKKRCTTVDAITDAFTEVLNLLQALNPDLKVILTVSPVRHWKDGAEENSISKAILRLACAHLSQRFNSVFYFPAYEMMLDEFRDYRFYADDLLHPSKMAIDEIWERFSGAVMSESTITINKKIIQLNKALAHRAQRKNGDAYHKHLHYIQSTLSALEGAQPHIDFTPQRNILHREWT